MTTTKPTYKETNIPWMEGIPEHWEVRRLKYLGYMYSGLSGKKGDDFLKEEFFNAYYIPFTSISDEINVKSKELKPVAIFEDEQQNKVAKDDLFFLMSSENMEYIGKTAILLEYLENVYLNSFCKGFRIVDKDINPKYLNYCLSSTYYRQLLSIKGRGFTRINIKKSSVLGFKVFLPPLSEQTAIANYLDSQSQKIKHFIKKKQAFIELLKEQRQAVIDKAVTKGINPHVKLKDSGIAWLGDIPEHWSLKRLKFVSDLRFSNVDKHTIKHEKIVRLCNYTDVYKNDYIIGSMGLMIASASDSKIEKFQVLKGDIIITKDSETPEDIAAPAYVKEYLDNVVCGYHLALIRTDETQILGEYLFRVFQSKKINSHFQIRATGVTRVGLSLGDISGVYIPFPKSKEEQAQIISHIKTATAKIDEAIAQAEKEIELIKEYKEAMIAEAVLGKLIVNG